MIESLRFVAGPSKDSPQLEFKPGTVTVFVGPNNSGKSQILREVDAACKTGKLPDAHPILEAVKLDKIPTKYHEQIIDFATSQQDSNNQDPEQLVLRKAHLTQKTTQEELVGALNNPGSGHPYAWLGRHLTSYLGGTERLALLQDAKLDDFLEPPTGHLDALLRDEDARTEWREVVHEAFGIYPVLDSTKPGTVRVRFSKKAPNSETLEKSYETDAIDFQKAALPVSAVSDGVLAFTGILAQALAGIARVIIIDESEAFHHPPLAFKLGKKLANIAQKRGQKIFAATHSAEFLMGCIHSGVPVDIVRLTYREQMASARRLPGQDVQSLFRDPYLRSAKVLQALFHDAAIVCEADSDRAFYEEINHRLLETQSQRAIPNCLFLNANGKDSLCRITTPLRKLGVPAASIADIDVFKLEGRTWSNYLAGGLVPSSVSQPWGIWRKSVFDAFASSGKDMKREGGVELLEEEPKKIAISLVNALAGFGLFLVKHGELEAWLRDLDVNRNKGAWLSEVFEKLGDNPDDSSYIRPTEGDVWDFLGEIKKWLHQSP